MFRIRSYGESNGFKRCLVMLCFLLIWFSSIVRVWADSSGAQKILLAQASQAAPQAPSDLKAIVNKEMIELQWRDNSENEDGFKIYCNSILIGSVGRNITNFQHKDLEPGKLHRYEVRAFNSNGESEPASTLETPPYEEHY